MRGHLLMLTSDFPFRILGRGLVVGKGKTIDLLILKCKVFQMQKLSFLGGCRGFGPIENCRGVEETLLYITRLKPETYHIRVKRPASNAFAVKPSLKSKIRVL